MTEGRRSGGGTWAATLADQGSGADAAPAS